MAPKAPNVINRGLLDFERRRPDAPGGDIYKAPIDVQHHTVGDIQNRTLTQLAKADTIKRQLFTAKIMSQLSDITVKNVFKKDIRFASKFPDQNSKKIIKRYKVWISSLNQITPVPTSYGSAYVKNKAFIGADEKQLEQMARDTIVINDFKTAYYELEPGSPGSLDEPKIGDEVEVFTTEQDTFEDIRIVRLTSKVNGALFLKKLLKKKGGNTKVKINRNADPATVFRGVVAQTADGTNLLLDPEWNEFLRSEQGQLFSRYLQQRGIDAKDLFSDPLTFMKKVEAISRKQGEMADVSLRASEDQFKLQETVYTLGANLVFEGALNAANSALVGAVNASTNGDWVSGVPAAPGFSSQDPSYFQQRGAQDANNGFYQPVQRRTTPLETNSEGAPVVNLGARWTRVGQQRR